jgi:hypothetical protein
MKAKILSDKVSTKSSWISISIDSRRSVAIYKFFLQDCKQYICTYNMSLSGGAVEKKQTMSARVTSWDCDKIAQNVALFVKINANLNLGKKSSQTFLATSVIFLNLPKVKYRPIWSPWCQLSFLLTTKSLDGNAPQAANDFFCQNLTSTTWST